MVTQQPLAETRFAVAAYMALSRNQHMAPNEEEFLWRAADTKTLLD